MNNVKIAMNKVATDILIYINDKYEIKFSKVFEFPNSEGCYVGHINIWNEHAPFYFVFRKTDLTALNIKGFHNCSFIMNLFSIEVDKNGKLYLKAIKQRTNERTVCYLKYYPITTTKQSKEVAKLRKEGHNIYSAYNKNGNISIGEAIEIVKTNYYETDKN